MAEHPTDGPPPGLDPDPGDDALDALISQLGSVASPPPAPAWPDADAHSAPPDTASPHAAPPDPAKPDPVDALVSRLHAPPAPSAAPAWPDEVRPPAAAPAWTDAALPPSVPAEAPAPTAARANRTPRWGRSLAVVAAVAAAALLFLQLRPATDDGAGPRVGLRGGGATTATVALELDRVRDGVSHRLATGDTLALGDTVYLQVSATRATPVTVWVDGPEGREDLARQRALPQAAPLKDGDGHVAFAFDGPGTYTFTAAPERGDGAPAQVTLDVR